MQNLELARKYGLGEAVSFYEEVDREGKNTADLADRFAVLRWKFIEKMREDPKFESEYKKLVLEVRRRVVEV